MWKRQPEEEVTKDIEPGEDYNNRQLEAKADLWLREDARSEICRECGERGAETGFLKDMPQFTPEGEPLTDSRGRQLKLEFPEIKCSNDHSWFQGEGQARGIGGDAPILFEEHFQSRKRREIYTSLGTPDPSIVAGIYNRTHPQGRKVNSDEQRRKNGASFFR
jgi:hypothetical protein